MRYHKGKPIGIIFISCCCFYSGAFGMAVLTGGKSHLEIASNITKTTPTSPFTTGSSGRTRVTRPTRLRREVPSSLMREFASLQRNVSSIQPETINRFPPIFARLLATLFSDNRQRAPPADAETMFFGDGQNRRKRQAGMTSLANSKLICPIEPEACQDAPFDAILPHDDFMFGFKQDKVYMLSPSGDIIVPQPIPSQDIFPGIMENVTAVLRINDFTYVFFGSTYMKFKPVRRPSMFPAPVPVPSGFHGVPTPVDAAFKLNAHTYVFISGNRFVFYQPDGNPPVNPQYSPNSLKNIRDGPTIVDSAFNTPDGRRFLTAGDMMYELDGKMQVIKTQTFKRQRDGTGWLNCPLISPTNCTTEEQTTTSTVVEQSSTSPPVMLTRATEQSSTQSTSSLSTSTVAPTAAPTSSSTKEQPKLQAIGVSVLVMGKPISTAAPAIPSQPINLATGLFDTAKSSSATPADDALAFSVENSTSSSSHLNDSTQGMLLPSGNDGLKRRDEKSTGTSSKRSQEPPSGIHENAEGVEELVGDPADAFVEKFPVNAKFIEQLEMQKAVLRELMAKLNNLTLAISQLPSS